MAEAERAYEGIDERDPSQVLMEKEDAMLIPFPMSGRITMEMFYAIGDFAIGNPDRFQTIKTKSFYPQMTLNQISKFLGVSRRTVINHLKPVNLKIKAAQKTKGLK